MTLELLPNELLFKCFKYLNGIDIFCSFDQLNYRFNKLIRSIPLYIDFRHVQTSIFNQFCMKMLSDQEIKYQVYALHLSNKDIYCQIQPFLSLFSLDAFYNLRSLTLTRITKKNVSQLEPMLLLITQLSTFRIIHSRSTNYETVLALPNSELQTLMLPSLPSNLKLIYNVSSIVNLTITACNLMGIYEILIDVPQLKYLNVQYVSKSHYRVMYKNPIDCEAVQLRKLIITNFQDTFSDLIIVLKLTPKLKNLILDAYSDADMIDASQWQHLITSSLPDLKSFKFRFQKIFWCTVFAYFHSKFKEFQSNFWKEHHWYTEYSFSNNRALIYTVPYVSDTYELMVNSSRYCNESIGNFNIFKNTTNVTINCDALTESCQYHFPYVTSIPLKYSRFDIENNSVLQKQHIESLKKVVNLSNVKHLDISYFRKLKTANVLSEFLREAAQVSSIAMQSSALVPLFDDNGLCDYLNTRIKQLEIKCIDLFKNSYEMDRFCEIFLNLEQLTCTIKHRDFLIYLLMHLPKLSRLNLYSSLHNLGNADSLEEEMRKLGIGIIIDVPHDWYPVPIWIIRNIY